MKWKGFWDGEYDADPSELAAMQEEWSPTGSDYWVNFGVEGLNPDGSPYVVHEHIDRTRYAAGTCSAKLPFVDDTPTLTSKTVVSPLTTFTIDASFTLTLDGIAASTAYDVGYGTALTRDELLRHPYLTFGAYWEGPPDTISHDWSHSTIVGEWFQRDDHPDIPIFATPWDEVNHSWFVTFKGESLTIAPSGGAPVLDDLYTITWGKMTIDNFDLPPAHVGYVTTTILAIKDHGKVGWGYNSFEYDTIEANYAVGPLKDTIDPMENPRYSWLPEIGPFTIQGTDPDKVVPGGPAPANGTFVYLNFPLAHKKKNFYTVFQPYIGGDFPPYHDPSLTREHHTPYGSFTNTKDLFPWMHCSTAQHLVQGFGFALDADPEDTDAEYKLYINDQDVGDAIKTALGISDLKDIQSIMLNVPVAVINALK